jgi:hypothetical protein
MKSDRRNPFNITKAVDFTDPEINRFFVDLPESSYADILKPTSPMPMLIVGGKGSGKTHLMRYFSYDVQLMRNTDPLAALRSDGFIGLYFRCSGLNTERFAGKNQNDEVWRAIFEYYMELWIAQLTIDALADIFARTPVLSAHESSFAQRVSIEAAIPTSFAVASLADISKVLRDRRAEVDFAVNNSALSRGLPMPVTIALTRGSLIFGIPRLLGASVPELNGISVLYLIDEFENLAITQQQYVNTLIRERQPPTCIKVGVRRYGLRTFTTYSAGEENRDGSEYETLDLDERLRTNPKAYEAFAFRLVGRRLAESRIQHPPAASDPESIGQWAAECFQTIPKTHLYVSETAFVVDKYAKRERPYFTLLRQKLSKYRTRAPGVENDQNIDEVVESLSLTAFPFVEKLNIFLLFRRWSKKHDLLAAAREIGALGARYAAGDDSPDHDKANSHFGADLYAQLLRQCDQSQRYLGLSTFIEMSNGFPRHLLVTLKNVVNWSLFEGGEPFAQGPMSFSAQEAGVREASDWFLRDAGTASSDSLHVKASIDRLATLFRSIRYADKPPECSVIAFSLDVGKVTSAAARTIKTATDWSLLIEGSEGRRDKNSMRVDRKFQLNGLLCPRWDLPIYLRATWPLAPELANAIFDPSSVALYDSLLARLAARMNAPFTSNGDDLATEQAAIQFQD